MINVIVVFDAILMLIVMVRWALIPAIVARLLQGSISDLSEADKNIETQLMGAILQVNRRDDECRDEQERHI